MLRSEKGRQLTKPVALPAESELDPETEFESVVRPREHLFSIPIQEVWTSRQLLYFLVWRDFKVRYQQAVVGAGWAILKPLLLMLVFVFVFGIFIRVPTGDVPYSLFVYSGLLPWMFISTVISASATSLIINGSLVTKVYFPRLIAPLSASTVALIDFMISLPLLLGLMLWFGVDFTPRMLILPLLIILLFLLALSIGLVMAPLHIRYQDINLLLPIILQVWMYATPIIYPVNLVPAPWLPIYNLNPSVGLIQGFRWALLDAPAPTPYMLASCAVITLVVFLGSVLFFQHTETMFADYV